MAIISSDRVGEGLRSRGRRIPKGRYTSREFLALEYESLWPKVWQVACREEEFHQVGDFVEYEIGDQSVVVFKIGEAEYRAYDNACPHRGTRLAEGHGRMPRIRCPFHGWRWNLDGECTEIVDREDYEGLLCEADVALRPVHLATWGGFVFVTLDSDPEPLAEYLSPVIEYLTPYRFDEMRFRWYRTTVLPCNWKVAIDAFIEAYHVAGTHPQLLPYYDDRTVSVPQGRHGCFKNVPDSDGVGVPSRKLNWGDRPFDRRENVFRFIELMSDDLKAVFTERDREAARRLLDEVPVDADAFTVLGSFLMFQKEAADADGSGWPDITIEALLNGGLDWHIFPNTVILPNIDGAVTYRSRPFGDDPDRCVFDVWSLARYAAGTEPPLQRGSYADWRDCPDWGKIFTQDLTNMAKVQRGMHSRSFDSLQLNPKQESLISNYHEVMDTYLFADPR